MKTPRKNAPIMTVHVDATRHFAQLDLEPHTCHSMPDVEALIDHAIHGDEQYVRCLYVQTFTPQERKEGFCTYLTVSRKFDMGEGGDTKGLDAFRTFARAFFKAQPIDKKKAIEEIVHKMSISGFSSKSIANAIMHLDNHEPTQERVDKLGAGIPPKEVERKLQAEKEEKKKGT